MSGIGPIHPEPNYDESRAGTRPLPPLAGPDGVPPRTPRDIIEAQAHWRDLLAHQLYGPIPPNPDSVAIKRAPLPEDRCEHVTITCRVGARAMTVDAAFWRPETQVSPAPLIVGLGFLGPAGVLFDDAFPIDPAAIVAGGADLRLRGGHLDEVVRGMHAHRWPIALLRRAGFGVLLTCYGSWTPDDATLYRRQGTMTLFDSPQTGAISLWAWAASRLVDAALQIDDVDPARIVLAGHSRLGKAVLWAGANDPRVAAVFANNAGCAGPALSRRNFGESLFHLATRFPHWMVLDRDTAAQPDMLAFDQHHLLACLAPRQLYLASGSDDLWADPRGEFLGLSAALPAWRITDPSLALVGADAALTPGTALRSGPLGWHLRPGGHALTPWDWRHVARFLAPLA
jgi:hypothetical protein